MNSHNVTRILDNTKGQHMCVCTPSRCLEVIITEQVEKLTASLRSIRSLTSHARSKALKLTQLSQVCTGSIMLQLSKLARRAYFQSG